MTTTCREVGYTGASGGATWPWLGAALARTRNIQIGTSVTAPILRYNLAVVAQVFAKLDFTFSGRTFLTAERGASRSMRFLPGTPGPLARRGVAGLGNRRDKEALGRGLGQL